MVSAVDGNYGARLREERMRIDPHQGNFAQKLGIRQGQLSDWEKGSTIKIEQLAALANAGVDVLYVVTGQRCSATLAPAEAEIVESFRNLSASAQTALITLMDELDGTPKTRSRSGIEVEGSQIQENRQNYRAT